MKLFVNRPSTKDEEDVNAIEFFDTTMKFFGRKKRKNENEFVPLAVIQNEQKCMYCESTLIISMETAF